MRTTISAIKLHDVDANYSSPMHFGWRSKLCISKPQPKNSVATPF
jgi:hypothetical protein